MRGITPTDGMIVRIARQTEEPALFFRDLEHGGDARMHKIVSFYAFMLK